MRELKSLGVDVYFEEQNSKYRRMIWQCNAKFKDGHHCNTPHLTETGIQEKFLNAFNQLIDQRDFIAKDIKIIVDFLTDTTALKSEAAELHDEMEIVTELMKQAIAQNASMAMDQEEYAARYNALAGRYQNAANRYKAIEAESTSRTSQRKMLTSFAKQLMDSNEKVAEFTPTLWNAMVEKVTVDADGIMHFTFKNGTVLPMKSVAVSTCRVLLNMYPSVKTFLTCSTTPLSALRIVKMMYSSNWPT